MSWFSEHDPTRKIRKEISRVGRRIDREVRRVGRQADDLVHRAGRNIDRYKYDLLTGGMYYGYKEQAHQLGKGVTAAAAMFMPQYVPMYQNQGSLLTPATPQSMSFGDGMSGGFGGGLGGSAFGGDAQGAGTLLSSPSSAARIRRM